MGKLKFVYNYLRKELSDILHLYQLQKKFPQVKFGKRLDIQKIDKVSFAPHTSIGNDTIINCGGDWSDDRGWFECGNNVFFGQKCVIYSAGTITIGDNALIAAGVSILSHQHSYSDRTKNYYEQESEFLPVKIGDNVYIGANATILPGVTIGDGAIVGANSVVTKDVPQKTMVAGVPALKIKSL
ncbi:MAG: acyltransferase [Bacteroidota bacterium]